MRPPMYKFFIIITEQKTQYKITSAAVAIQVDAIRSLDRMYCGIQEALLLIWERDVCIFMYINIAHIMHDR